MQKVVARSLALILDTTFINSMILYEGSGFEAKDRSSFLHDLISLEILFVKDEDLELDLFFILLYHIILFVLPLEIILIEELVSCVTIRMLQEGSQRRIILMSYLFKK